MSAEHPRSGHSTSFRGAEDSLLELSGPRGQVDRRFTGRFGTRVTLPVGPGRRISRRRRGGDRHWPKSRARVPPTGTPLGEQSACRRSRSAPGCRSSSSISEKLAATAAGFCGSRSGFGGFFAVAARGQPWHGGCPRRILSIPAASSAVAVNGRGGSARMATIPALAHGRGARPTGLRPAVSLLFLALTSVLPVGGAGVVPFAGARRQDGEVHRALRHLLRPGGAHRPVLDGARPAGEDRAQAPPPAVRGDPHAVPAVAGVRRAAVAARLAVGVHETGRLQAGLRHRQAARLLQGARPDPEPETPPRDMRRRASRALEERGVPATELDSAFAPTWRRSRRGWPRATPASEVS